MPITLIRVVLNGGQISSMDDVYDSLSAQLDLPAHFGRNLDALWDVLTTDVAGPLEIVWENAALSQKKLGHKFEQLTELLQDMEEEYPEITVKFE